MRSCYLLLVDVGLRIFTSFECLTRCRHRDASWSSRLYQHRQRATVVSSNVTRLCCWRSASVQTRSVLLLCPLVSVCPPFSNSIFDTAALTMRILVMCISRRTEKSHSTETALLEVFNDLLQAADAGQVNSSLFSRPSGCVRYRRSPSLAATVATQFWNRRLCLGVVYSSYLCGLRRCFIPANMFLPHFRNIRAVARR